MKTHIVMYVGAGFDKDGESISHEKEETATRIVEAAICKVAGGFTRTEAIGGWVDADGKIIREPTIKFDIIYDNFNSDAAKVAFRLARLAKKEFNQNEVLIELIPDVVTLTSSKAY